LGSLRLGAECLDVTRSFSFFRQLKSLLELYTGLDYFDRKVLNILHGREFSFGLENIIFSPSKYIATLYSPLVAEGRCEVSEKSPGSQSNIILYWIGPHV